jgi:predicted RND superfamily exporter protein
LLRSSLIFLSAALVTVVLVLPLNTLRVDNTAESWLPTDSPGLRSLKAFESRFGDGSLLMAYVSGPNLPQHLVQWKSLTAQLRTLPSLDAVYPPRFVEEEDDGPKPPVTAYLNSPDNAHAAFLLQAKTGLSVDDQTKLIERLEGILVKSPPPLGPFGLAGTMVITHDLDTGSKESLSMMGPLVALAMCALLFFSTRQWRGVLASLVVIFLASLWSLGLMAYLGRPLNLVVSTLPPILAVVVITQAMHILAFFHSFPATHSRDLAWREALKGIFWPSLLCCVTTATGFASLAISTIPPIRDLGIFTAFGVVSTFVLSFTLFPSLLRLSSAVLPRGAQAQTWFTLNRANTYTHWLLRWRMPIIGAIIGAAALALLGIYQIRVESHILEFFPSSHRVPANYRAIEKNLMGLTPIDIVFSGPRDVLLSDKSLAAYKRFFSEVVESEPLVQQLVSILIEPTREKKLDFVLTPAELREAIASDDLPAAISRFLALDGNRIILRSTLLTTTDSSNAVFGLIERLRTRLAAQSIDATISGEIEGPTPLFVEGQVLLLKTQIESFAIALAVTALVVFAGFRSVRVAILALLPNVVPIALTLGFMGWSGIPLNTATVTVAGIALGLIVDDTIHFLYRYLNARKEADPAAAVGRALFTMGKAAIVSSGAVALGFALFAFSPFKPTAYFGLLIAITAISASVCDLVFLPALLARSATDAPLPASDNLK